MSGGILVTGFEPFGGDAFPGDESTGEAFGGEESTPF